MAGIERKGRKCWSRSEDKALRNAVSRRGPHRWAHVAGEPGLEKRTPKSCRLRWLNHLNPTVVKERFREEESRAVALGYVRFGSRWSSIARELRGRTDSAVKNHWNNYLRQRYVRLLSDILQNPQVSDIRAAAAFGVGPSMLKAAIMSNAPPFAGIEESQNPASECVSGHVSQNTDGSDGANNIIQSLFPGSSEPQSTQSVVTQDLMSQNGIPWLQKDVRLTPIEELMRTRGSDGYNMEFLNAARNQMIEKSLHIQSEPSEELKSLGNVRSWTRTNAFSQSPLNMFGPCTGVNNTLEANLGGVSGDECAEPNMRRLNSDTMSTTMFSSCSTNTLEHVNEGFENPVERNIRSLGGNFSTQGGNANYGFPNSLMLQHSSQGSELDLYRDSLGHIENNSRSNFTSANTLPSNFSNNNKNSHNSLGFQVSHSGGAETTRDDLFGDKNWNSVGGQQMNLNSPELTMRGIKSSGMGGFLGQPFVSTAEIIPDSDRVQELSGKQEETENLSQLAETLLTLFNGDMDATRQFLENMSDYQRSQLEEQIYHSSNVEDSSYMPTREIGRR